MPRYIFFLTEKNSKSKYHSSLTSATDFPVFEVKIKISHSVSLTSSIALHVTERSIVHQYDSELWSFPVKKVRGAERR